MKLRPNSPAVENHLAASALFLMMLIPVFEMLLRPLQARGVDNAPSLVQHLGLMMSMLGALAAERHAGLARLGNIGRYFNSPRAPRYTQSAGMIMSAVICGGLSYAGLDLARSEWDSAHTLSYGLPLAYAQGLLPLGFLLIGVRLGARACNALSRHPSDHLAQKLWTQAVALGLCALGYGVAQMGLMQDAPKVLAYGLLLLMLALDAPIFAVMAGLAWVLFAGEGLPLASLALSHYQITINPSLPALPLFTLAGLLLASGQSSKRLSTLFICIFGAGQIGTMAAVAVLCSCFTALTGGSGVTILALGGLLMPLLTRAHYPERQSMGLITAASALGVLLAPAVPLIMYAIIAKIPINTMFVAGILPALLMVACLVILGLVVKGRQKDASTSPLKVQATNEEALDPKTARASVLQSAWAAKWELIAPVVAIGSLVSGLTTPTESAAITALYAALVQVVFKKDLDVKGFWACLTQTAQLIGGVMLIMGLALGLTNYLIDQGIPDMAIEQFQSITHNKYWFLLALNVFLLICGALMEIYAALIVLVPLLLPLAMSYGVDPVHFGIVFLANLEIGFLCPPAGMNIYFAAAVFQKPIHEVVRSVLTPALAFFLGSLILSCTPILVTFLPDLFQMSR
jgi:tripartite ATP-independent transporter DctM subunit